MTQETAKIKVAIIGSGNIGTDLMIKVMRTAKHLEMESITALKQAGVTALAEWKIPANTPVGKYRIKHRGVAVPAGSPEEFEGISEAFDVTATGATCSDGRTL